MVSGQLFKAGTKSLTEAFGGYQGLTFCRMIELERENRWSLVLESKTLKRKLLQTVSRAAIKARTRLPT